MKISITKETLLYLLIYLGYVKNLFYNIGNIISIVQYCVLALAILLIFFSPDRKVDLKYNHIILSTVLLIVYCMITKIWSDSVIYSSNKLFELLICLLYLFPFYFLGRNFDLNKFLKTAIVGNTLFLILYSIVNIRSLVMLASSYQRVGSAYSDNPVWVCRLCCETLIILFIFDFSSKNKISLMRVVQYLFLLFIALRSGSKGPLVSMFATILFVVISVFNSLSKEIKSRMKKILLAIVIALVIIYVFFHNAINSMLRISTTFSNAKGYRINMYTQTIENLGIFPLGGHGLGSWPLFYWNNDFVSYPHNIILELWYECGLIGVVILVFLFIHIYRSVKTSHNINFGILSALFFNSLICAMFSGSISSGNRGIYLFAILCGVSLFNINKNIELEEVI